MIFKYLSGKFYHDFPSADYPEMMLKEQRPYTITKKQNLTLKKNTMLNIADTLLCNILKNTSI